jgi:MoaA/NifB/PqqE/SkfB family radical SAM enzyme
MSETQQPQPSAYSQLMNKAFAKAIPLNCQIEITYRCNHLCSFCYNSPTGEREMTTEQIFEVLRKIADFGVLYCTLTGGEALCHKDFFKIAAEVRRLGMALRIYSNGYLMADRKIVRKIKELDPMEVEISVHGSKAETHEALTKIKGSFARTIKAIRNLRKAGVKVLLKCPITRINQDELFDLKALADDLGCKIIFDAVITPKDDGSLDPLALRAGDDFVEKYWGEWYAKLHDGEEPPKTNHCASDGSTANCGTARSGFSIDPYGNLLPCVAFRRVAGNVLRIDRLDEFWQSSPVLNEVRDLAVEATERVKKHEDGAFINGFCLGVAETQTGDPLGMYPQAEVNAKAVRRNFELLQIGGGSPGRRKSA